MFKHLHHFLLVLLATFAISCSKEDTITVQGQYQNGFYILNEGWFGHETGSVHFYDYTTDSLYTRVYGKANPGADSLGTSSNTLQYGTIFNNRLYLVVKAGGPVVVADANTLKETGRITTAPDNNAQAFIGIDNTHGLLSTTGGVYPVNLSTLAVDTKISGVSGAVGNMIKAGSYVFVLSATDGIIALKTSDYSVVKKLGAATTGFALGKDGAVWAANATALLKINPSTLTIDTIQAGFNILYNPWAWTSSAIASSTRENAVYIIADNGFSGSTKVYRYVPGNAASLSAPFITLPTGQFFYGTGIGYNAAKDQLILTTTTSAFGSSSNQLLFCNASTGALQQTITYQGWFFPAMVVFH